MTSLGKGLLPDIKMGKRWPSQMDTTQVLGITLANVDRFSKFFIVWLGNNLQQDFRYVSHHALSVSLHDFVKYKR